MPPSFKPLGHLAGATGRCQSPLSRGATPPPSGALKPKKALDKSERYAAISLEVAGTLWNQLPKFDEAWQESGTRIESICINLSRSDRLLLGKLLCSNGLIHATGSTDVQGNSLPPFYHLLIERAHDFVANRMCEHIKLGDDSTGTTRLRRDSALELAKLLFRGQVHLKDFCTQIQKLHATCGGAIAWLIT